MLLRNVVRIAVAVTAICTALGVAAALGGGSLDGLGSGAGGLQGFPALVLVGLAVLGIVAGLATLLRRRGLARGLVLLAGPAFVFVSFFQLPHALDPCASGRWDLRARVAGAPACGTWGGGLEIHQRFHLLMHAAPGLVAALAFAAAAASVDAAPASPVRPYDGRVRGRSSAG